MDVFHDRLLRARASGGVFARSVARPPWGLRMGGTIQLAVHAVMQGTAWLWAEDPDTAIELRPNDLALVCGGPDHYIAYQPRAACVNHEEFQAAAPDGDASSDPAASVFLCGAYQFSGEVD